MKATAQSDWNGLRDEAFAGVANHRSGGRQTAAFPPKINKTGFLPKAATSLLKMAICLAVALGAIAGRAEVIFERISAYHHILVYDDAATQVRTLSFNGSWETKMSLTNSLTGHFEYTEYFQAPWIWNHHIKRVLMIGLGGGSTQRAWQHYYTNVFADTVEIDPVVVDVAHKYFNVTESPNLAIHTNDGRVFLRRTTNTYDVILMDAYSTTRYGSSLPKHLTTREFFLIARDHLTTNGVLAYNVIGQIYGQRANIVGALYRTLKDVFPQVYLFPAVETQNVVMVATMSSERYDTARIKSEGATLISSGTVTLPTFALRLDSFWDGTPPTAASSPVLTDDYAPIEGLLQGRR
jgi:spermidine synthase